MVLELQRFRQYEDQAFSLLLTVIMENIFNCLPLRDQLTISQICHSWRNFVFSGNHLEKCLIDPSSPYGCCWKEINTLKGLTNWKESNEFNECRKTMDMFISRLASVTAGCIENIEIDLINVRGSVSPEAVNKLLAKQKKIVSLSIHLYYLKVEERAELERSILTSVRKHQSTLVCIEISNTGICLKNFCQLNATLPNLKSIGFPVLHMLLLVMQGKAPVDKATAIKCFTQTLGNGKVEVINVNMRPGPDVWFSELTSALKSVIEMGLTSNLRKVCINTIGYTEENIQSELDIVINNCPGLTHLYSISIHINNHGTVWPSESITFNTRSNHSTLMRALPLLISHYSKNLLLIATEINDDIDEIISVNCSNLKTLIAVAVKTTDCPLSNKGILALSKLQKPERFHLYLEKFETVTVPDILEFLEISVIHFEELCLNMPERFYDDISVYEVLSKGSKSLHKLGLSCHFVANWPDYQPFDGIVYMQCVQKSIEKCTSLKCLWLDIDIHEKYENESAMNAKIMPVISSFFETVVKVHPKLRTSQI